MATVAEIIVPVPPDLTVCPDGCYATEGQAYAVAMPAVASDALRITNAQGLTLSWRPTELAYRGLDDAGVPHYDYVIGSAPVSVAVNRRQAVYERLFPNGRDVFQMRPEQVKHHTILNQPPRCPAVYITHDAEFGVCGLLGGVPMAPGLHETMEGFGFAFGRPVARDMAGASVEGRYEVLDTDGGQQLFTWFPAGWILSPDRVWPINLDPVIATTTFNNSMSSPQHRIGIFSNGVQLAIFWTDATNDLRCRVSADKGQTWTIPTAGEIVTTSWYFRYGTLKIVDDYVNMVGNSTGATYFMSGTPTTARTGFTWGAAFGAMSFSGSGAAFDAELVVRAEATGWKAHVFSSEQIVGSEYQKLWYQRLTIASDRTVSLDGANLNLHFVDGGYGKACPDVAIASNKNVGVIWSYGSILYYRAATYSGGTWTWGAQENVTTALAGWYNLIYDNSDLPVVVYKHTDTYLRVVRRVGSTWTALTGLPNIVAGSIGLGINRNTGDLYVFFTSSAQGLAYVKWTAATGTWGSVVVLDSDTTAGSLTITQETAGVGFCLSYVTGTSPNYAIKSFYLPMNTAPQAPTINTPAAFHAAAGLTVPIVQNDQDPGDSMAGVYYKTVDNLGNARWRTAAGAWQATEPTSPIPNTGGGSSMNLVIADGWAAGRTYQQFAATVDAAGVKGPYNTAAVTVKASTKPMFNQTTPASGGTVNTTQVQVQGTTTCAAGVTPKQTIVRLLAADGTTQLVAPVTLDTPGALDYTIPYNQTTATGYRTGVTPIDSDGLVGDEVVTPYTTAFIPPNTPEINVLPNSGGARIEVPITNPAGGTQVVGNDVYRRVFGTGPYVRIKSGLPAGTAFYDYTVASNVIYEYLVRAVGANGTTADSTSKLAAIVISSGLWLHDVMDPQGTAHFFQYREVALSDSRQYKAGEFQFAGRSGPVVRFDANMVQRPIGLRIALPDDTTDRVSIESLADARSTICMRDARGRRLFGVLKEVPITDELWGGWLDFKFTPVAYVEEV